MLQGTMGTRFHVIRTARQFDDADFYGEQMIEHGRRPTDLKCGVGAQACGTISTTPSASTREDRDPATAGVCDLTTSHSGTCS